MTGWLIVSALLLAQGAAASQPGLTVLPGGGCFGQSTRVRPCTPVRGGMDRASAVALSPDGRFLYVFGRHGGYQAPGSVGMIAVFARDRRTDALRQLRGREGCIGEIIGCLRVRMGQPSEEESIAQALIVTADGRNVYVAAADRIVVFARDSSNGTLTQLPGALGCVADASSPGRCTPSRSVGLAALAVSPNGADVYSAGGSALAALRRDPLTGALTQFPGSPQCTDDNGSEGCAVNDSLVKASGSP